MSKQPSQQPVSRGIAQAPPAAAKVAAKLIREAMTLHLRGEAAEAERIYRDILETEPDNFDANQLLGAVMLQRRQYAAAERLIAKALAIIPDNPAALDNYGIALGGLKRNDEALASHDKAIALKPDFTEAHSNRALLLKSMNRLDEALAGFDQAIALKPDYAEAHRNRGMVLKGLKRVAEALESYDRAIAINPGNPDAHNSRGNVLKELKQYDKALESFEKAVALRPDYAEAFVGRGLALKDLKRFDEALASFDKAIALKPDYANAYNNHGVALQAMKRNDASLSDFDRAIALDPDHAEAYNNRGIALEAMKRFGEALSNFDKAIALKPDYAESYANRALARLLTGRFSEGWADYEWRWAMKDFPSKKPNIKAPTWQGEDLSGRHLVVFAEQGLGDTLQFVRYLPLLARRGCTITFLVPANMLRLLRPALPQVTMASPTKDIQNIDFQISLMSLPHRFNTELSSVPNEVPYLKAEPELEARWKTRIGAHGFKVGITWQGNPKAKVDDGRSIPLKAYIPLGCVPGVRVISLQKRAGLDQLTQLPNGMNIETFDDFDSGPDAFVDTAAIMSGLDLIITSDTSIAHLAGALGRPTWVALKHVADWRWLLDRTDSPWYPTMRLFRQVERNNWTAVFSQIEVALRTLLDTRTFQNPSVNEQLMRELP